MDSDPEVIEYMQHHYPEFTGIMMRLRELIYEVVPEATESIMWSRPHFKLNKPVCYIGGFKKHVTLAFHDGRMLNDPDGILLGTGKKMKYLKFSTMEDLDEDRLKRWILEGFYT